MVFRKDVVSVSVYGVGLGLKSCRLCFSLAARIVWDRAAWTEPVGGAFDLPVKE